MFSNSNELIFPKDGYIFDTYTEIQSEYLKKIENEGINNAIDWLESVKNNIERTYPAVLRFEWLGNKGEKYKFELAEKEDFSDAYSVECSDTFCEIDNFKNNQKYFWRVNGGSSNYFFTKDNKFRFIKIDGALNVRDLGGEKISQGLVYRGTDIDVYYKITDEGIRTFCDRLKIKSEVELRIEVDGSRKSVVGNGVTLTHLPYRPYIEVFEDEHRKGICKIMEFFSHEENYPIYMHCLGGADRTGMIAIYLRAIVGECDEIIHTDYELTSLSTYAYGLAEGATGFRNRNSSYYVEFLNELDKYAPSKPLSEKVRLFLKDCGVTEECMEKIANILKAD